MRLRLTFISFCLLALAAYGHSHAANYSPPCFLEGGHWWCPTANDVYTFQSANSCTGSTVCTSGASGSCPYSTNCGSSVAYFGTLTDRNQREKNAGVPKDCVGNPCSSATGNKYQPEEDYSGAINGIAFTRSYNSLIAKDAGLGYGWIFPFSQRLEISGGIVQVRLGDGRGEPFNCTSLSYTGDADSKLKLVPSPTGYTLTLHDSTTERYDLTGKIVSDTSLTRQVTTYGYDSNGLLASVTNSFGHTLTFNYDTTGHISTVTTPANLVITYGYDPKNNLTRVDYPDGTAKLYHYENTAFFNHLTGISYVDSNNVTARYSTYTYDAEGKAISTGHANSADLHTLAG